MLDRFTQTQKRAARIHAEHTAVVSSCMLVVLCRGSLPGGLPQELLSTGMRFWAASITARQAAIKNGMHIPRCLCNVVPLGGTTHEQRSVRWVNLLRMQ
jgi:hypothetical protein